MKFPGLLLGFALVCCVGIAGYIHSKRKQEIYLNKQATFLDIKFRVTRDVVGEYQEQLTQTTSLLAKTKKEVEDLTSEVSNIKSESAKKKSAVDACKGEMKQIEKEIATSKTEKTSDQNEFVKERQRWVDEVAHLKKVASEPSKLCRFIDKNSEEGRKLCGMNELPKPVEKIPEAKPEEPIPDQPKPEEPKAEQPKPEQPLPEESKAEQSKPMEPKAKEPEVLIS